MFTEENVLFKGAESDLAIPNEPNRHIFPRTNGWGWPKMLVLLKETNRPFVLFRRITKYGTWQTTNKIEKNSPQKDPILGLVEWRLAPNKLMG